MSGRPWNPTDKLLTRLAQTSQGRQKLREAVERMKQREQWGAAQS